MSQSGGEIDIRNGKEVPSSIRVRDDQEHYNYLTKVVKSGSNEHFLLVGTAGSNRMSVRFEEVDDVIAALKLAKTLWGK